MMTREKETTQQGILTVAHNNYGKGLNAYASFKVNSRALGEDLVQDTFVKTWRYLVRDGKIDMMKAFLYRVLNNLIVDEYRKHKTSSLDALIEKGFEPSENVEERIFNVFDGKAASLLIKDLPKKYQEVMSMRYIRLLSLKEIALITGQSKNTVAVQAHRGLQKLKMLYSLATGNSNLLV